MALVLAPTVWLYETEALTGRVLEVSSGTRLPVVSAGDEAVEVLQVGGAHAYVRRAGVVLHEAGTAWPAPTGAQLVKQARRFIGRPYVWAGTSGFCLDCSGFTHLVYRALGVTIPRDAADQATVGRRIATRSALRPGDLVFFRASSGAIHHVGPVRRGRPDDPRAEVRQLRPDRIAGARTVPQRVRRRPAADAVTGRRCDLG